MGTAVIESLGGATPPAGLSDNLTSFSALPEAARERFWELLEPNLGESIDDAVAALVARFCAATAATEDQLAPIVGACRHLFRTAAGRDVGIDQMARDLGRLGCDANTVAKLSSCYAKALMQIRATNIVQFMGEYGAVLDDVRMRVDYVRTSQHDAGAMVPIAQMSLRYSDSGKEERLALQVSMATLRKLRDLCTGLLPG